MSMEGHESATEVNLLPSVLFLSVVLISTLELTVGGTDSF